MLDYKGHILFVNQSSALELIIINCDFNNSMQYDNDPDKYQGEEIKYRVIVLNNS
jgi:hypothetical protein